MPEPIPRYVVENAPLPVILCALSGEVVDLNRAACTLLRKGEQASREALRGMHWSEAAPRLRSTGFDEAFRTAATGQPGHRLEVPIRWGSRAYRLFLVRVEQAIVLYFLEAQPLETSVAGPSTAAAHVPGEIGALQAAYPFGSVATFDHEFRYRSVSGAGWIDLGIDASDLEGSTFRELWDSETADRLEELAATALAGFQAMGRIPFEGSMFEVWAGPISPGSETPLGLFYSRDVTREVERLERVSLLEAGTAAASMGVTLVDLRGDDEPLVYASGGFERLTGYAVDEILGRNCRFLQGDKTDPLTVKNIGDAIERRAHHQVTILNYRKDGTPFWNRLTLAPFSTDGRTVSHYIGVQEDVTEIREAAVERDHQRRLAELGTLAGSLAHDFNNILMEIQGRLSLIDDMELPADLDHELAGLLAASRRGSTLVEQLLGYARRSVHNEDAESGVSLVPEVMKAVARLLPSTVRVDLVYPDEGLPIALDFVRMEQILLNLAKNASEAMPRGGTFKVVLSRAEQPGWAELVVSDDGVGMSEETLAHAFDRFFTTKGDSGTGLGLSSVKQLVERAGGRITAHSEEGVGTVFELRLPLAGAQPQRDAGAPRESRPDRPTSLAGLRLLLVDDNPGIRDVLARLLGKAGLIVVTAAGGPEGFETYRAAQNGFDLVLTDREMPDGGGVPLLQKIAGLDDDDTRPWLALMSGDLNDLPDLPPATILIQKPFEAPELLETLRRGIRSGSE